MKRRPKVGIRRNSGFSLNVMTDDEVNEIHLATLEQKIEILTHSKVANS